MIHFLWFMSICVNCWLVPVFVQLGAPEKLQLLYELRPATDDKSKERLMNILKIAAHLGTGLLGPHSSELVSEITNDYVGVISVTVA